MRPRLFNATEADSEAETDGILVIDDDADVLETMVEALIDAGYAPLYATDSRQALKLLDYITFDLIVSDIMMPGLDGLTLLDLVKERNRDVEVLLVTGYGSRHVAELAARKGASGFLEKPLDPDRLLGAVRQVLWRSRLKRRLRVRSTAKAS